MGRKRKHRTEAELRERNRLAQARYRAKNRDKINAMQNERNRATLAPSAAVALGARISALETEIKDMLLDLEECLKENKKLADQIKWRKR
jgi:hypothetical protein